MAEGEEAAVPAAVSMPGPDVHQVDPEDHAKMKAGEKPYVPGQEQEEPEKDEKSEEGEPKREGADKSEDANKVVDSDEKKDPDSDETDESEADLSSSYSSWTEEFSESGELAPETVKDIYDKVFADGLSDEDKAMFLGLVTAGITAQHQVATLSGWSLVGGQDQWDAMSDWAGKNLSEGEIEAFNKSTASEDKAESDAAIKGLHARFQMANGIEPSNEPDLTHDADAAGGDPPIASRQELATIQASKKYQTDAAYRDKIRRQLVRSRASGQYRNH